MMTDDEQIEHDYRSLCRALLVERFGKTTPEHHNVRRATETDAAALRLVHDREADSA